MERILIEKTTADPRVYEALGRFGAEITQLKPAFRAVLLPQGWTLSTTDEGSDLYDQLSRRRGVIGSAGGDCHYITLDRYITRKSPDWNDRKPGFEEVRAVTYSGTELHRVEVSIGSTTRASDKAYEDLRVWLNENHPGWEHPAYGWE